MSTSEAKTISSYGSIYLLANIVNRSAGFILIPLYTYTLSLEEYGLLAIVMAVSDLLAILFGMGFTAAMTRFYFDFDNDSDEQKLVISTTLLGFFALSLIILIFAYPIARLTVSVLFETTEYLGVFVFAIAGLIFTLLFEVVVGYTIIQKKAWSYLSIAISKAVLFIASNLILVFYLKLGVPGVIYATVISLGSLSLILSVGILRTVGTGFSFPLMREMVSYGIPLIPASFADAALPVVERHFINVLVGPSAVGIYSLGHRLASMLQMFIAKPFSEIFFVRRFETLAKGEDQGVFNRILLVFVALMITCSLGLSLFGHEIITLISPEEYLGIIPAIPVLGLCFVLSSLNLNIQLGIIYQKKTWTIPVIGLVALLASVPANYLLIGKFGILGAALALLLINILRIATTLTINLLIGTRLINIDWPRAIAIAFIGTAIGVLAINSFPQGFSIQWSVIKLLVIAGFVLFLFVTPLLDRKTKLELAALRR
ncbi:MAG: oligosaccharide flippase family protein [Gammaproteobacteria bacterium]